MALKAIGIIPARYASTRFPGKPLVLINGKPMIQRVYEQASKAKLLGEVVVATDDQRIADCVKQFGGKVALTSDNHQSGTDRCAQVLAQLHDKPSIIINIQGDEPFIQPEQIDDLVKCFDDPDTQIATLVKEITNREELDKHSIVKVARDVNGFALYFSRAIIPYIRQSGDYAFYKHIGIYAYRAAVLQEISSLPQSNLELAEGLEQLRWLENGYKIKTALTTLESIAVDTPEDLEKIISSKISR